MPMHRDQARRRAPFVGNEQGAWLVLKGDQTRRQPIPGDGHARCSKELG